MIKDKKLLLTFISLVLMFLIINYNFLTKWSSQGQFHVKQLNFYDPEMVHSDEYLIRELWLGEDHSDRINCIRDKEHTNKIVRNDLITMFDSMIHMMNHKSCNYSLIAGTLLSVVRNNKILQDWDYDMDIILLDDFCDIRNFSNYKIIKYTDDGPSMRVQFGYPYKDLHIDIYKSTENKSWVVNNINKLKDHATSIKIIEHLSVKILQDHVAFLDISYGDWSKQVVHCGKNIFMI